MSQLRDKLRIIERESGLDGLILRPLSARHLPPTIPEEQGWVAREALLDIRGRGRRTQMDLAEKLQIGDYPCPAGGCLLTDKNFAERMRDYFDHTEHPSIKDIPLLKVGRHFRLATGDKVIVAHNEAECRKLKRLCGYRDHLLVPIDFTGPTVLLQGGALPDAIEGQCADYAFREEDCVHL